MHQLTHLGSGVEMWVGGFLDCLYSAKSSGARGLRDAF